MVPLPLFKSPRQTADALRFIKFLSLAGAGIRPGDGDTSAGWEQSQVRQSPI
jgi:hypothetical protein